MGGCEDDTCRDIPPATGLGGSVLFQHPNINEGFPYWEELANLEPAPDGRMRLNAGVVEMRSAKPPEAPRQELM